MSGVESVIEIADPLVIRSLFSPVKPNGNEREHAEGLHHKLKGGSEKRDRDKLTADDLDTDEIKANDLSQKRPPFSFAKDVKHQNDQHTGVIVVHEGDDAEQTAEQDRTEKNQRARPKLSRPFCFFIEKNEQNADEKRPKHVLVQRGKPRACHDEIKGNLGDQCKQKKPKNVFFQVFRVKITLDDHKGKDRIGESADAGHPKVAVYGKNTPNMIDNHQDHCQDMK